MRSSYLFQVSPYAAMVVFAGGMAVRYATMRKRALWSERGSYDGGGRTGGARLLQASMFLLIVGHLVGLVFPQQVIQWNSTAYRLYALEALAFGLGLLALAGWAMTMWRHLARADGSTARQLADAVFLALLFTMLLSGSLIAALIRWGSSWGVLTLTPYAQSLLRGRPADRLIAGMPFLVRLHVFATFATVALLPATRVAPVVIVTVSRSLQFMFTVAWNLIEPPRRRLEAAARRLNPASRIWPEED